MTEAIILAGGLGTRLRSAVPDLPKCMAPVAGQPFLAHVIESLRREGVRRFIFSLGYMSETIEAWLQERYPALDYTTVVEPQPLGTGGAIALCLKEATTENVVVANGDTLFRISLPALADLHQQTGAVCTLALKPMEDFDRYGVVTMNEDGRITGFEEKKHYDKGLINGGLYFVRRAHFNNTAYPEKFSFEKDFLEPAVAKGWLYGSVQDGYFIDIGIPQDFEKAQQDLRGPVLDLSKVDKGWTLFLDRDGVLNTERKGSYILNWNEFSFSPGVLDSFEQLVTSFGRIILVTNQRGVHKGLMTEADLNDIHDQMKEAIEAAGGRIDAIYYCTDGDNRSFHRKPNPGMALQAKHDFPDIDLSRSVMVGNKPSDMRFGRSAGMFTVFLATTNPEEPFPHPDIDLRFDDLAGFAAALQS